MRLTHIIPSIYEWASGPTYSVTRLCESLIDHNNVVHLAALDWGKLATPPPAYVRLFPLGFGPRKLGCSPAMRRWLEKECTAGGTDVLHNHGMWQMNSVYPAWAAAKADVPLVSSPRGAFSKWALSQKAGRKRLFWHAMQRRALEVTTCFHATAESEFQDIRRLGFTQPVAVIPNGIDIPSAADKNERRRRPDGKRTALFLSRLHPGKGLTNLLEAWAVIERRFPDWQLRIVGDDRGFHGSDGFRERLVSLSQSLALSRVEFCGPLYGSAKEEALLNAELFVLPTYSENFGIAVAEALAHGTPAITTTGAPWSGLTEHDAGWWIDVGTEPLLACLVEAMSLSPADLIAKGANGLAWMKKDFSWKSLGKRMTETYQWIRGSGGSRPPWVALD